MRVLRSVLALALLVVASCSTASTEPSTLELLGTWSTDRFPDSPRGSYDYRLVFAADGRFEWTWSSYGLYEGQRATERSAYTRSIGTYAVEGDRLVLLTEESRTWDRFYGATSTEDVRRFSPAAATLYDRATFRVSSGVLTLDYFSYPLDAAVPTQATFRRPTFSVTAAP